jgi:GT2 family glycosyltransferase
MKENLAPIILFVYNRPKHTRKTLEALSNNLLADQSVLYIYCDGVSENSSLENNKNNELVKNVIREKKWCKEVIIVESPINKGLATSVINGVSDIVEKYGKIIVLEDDLLTAHTFLKFMNEALGRYVDCENVIQISGYSFPAPKIKANNSSFFLPLSSTWGWATWKHSWDSIDFECEDYRLVKDNSKIAYKFNFD